MDTLVSVFSALARGFRWTFDLAGMAVGVAPTPTSVGESLTAVGEGDLPGHTVRVQKTNEVEWESAFFRREMGLSETDL